MRLLLVAPVVLLLQAWSATAGTPRQQPQAQTSPSAGGAQQQAQLPSAPQPARPGSSPAIQADPSTDYDLFSVEKLREQLSRKPPLITLIVPNPNVPRFKVQVEGKRWQLPDLRTRMATAIPKMAVQVPYGGTTAADMARLNTPPQYFGSSGFTNAEVAQLPLFALETWFGKAAIKRALEARHDAELAHTREQIRQELAAVQEHNARVAAGLSDGDSADAKKADKDKKKQDEAKKKQDAKKKQAAKKKTATSAS